MTIFGFIFFNFIIMGRIKSEYPVGDFRIRRKPNAKGEVVIYQTIKRASQGSFYRFMTFTTFTLYGSLKNAESLRKTLQAGFLGLAVIPGTGCPAQASIGTNACGAYSSTKMIINLHIAKKLLNLRGRLESYE